MPERVSFFIDGFNVYHSVKTALAKRLITNGKWLDYHAMCASLLAEVANFRRGAQIAKIRYCTALAAFLTTTKPDVIDRHRAFISANEHFGVEVIYGNFKEKSLFCRATCKEQYLGHEEKETDVNIALELISAFLNDECDTAVIISGDTDLIPAVRMAKKLFPNKRVAVGFPFKRKNNDIEKVADFTFKIKADRYEKYQLPNSIILSSGTVITKPPTW